MMEEKMIRILDELKQDFEELSTRKTSIISTVKMTIETTTDDVRAIPGFLTSLETTIQNLQQMNKDLEEKIMQAQQSIDTVTTETEISSSNKSDLENTEERKRNQKTDLEAQIEDYQNKKVQLEKEFQELTQLVNMKDNDYNQLQVTTKQEIDEVNQKISEAGVRLESAKEENKLIVYLMDSGLLDVPEAEVVSIIASYPNGLTMAEIKEKVSMAPVRVQPTINNLLEKVLEHDPASDSYRILDSIKKELS
ncbi:MAG: hypothetical protein H7641_10315 [Candidatus Heimdallarchaeota archaeon]|nr:hypothetical protein [Candidatus Heimdallarchaeota archaeon]MCK4877955.1 hypothetical protein [Candidatus Heimdallarchaeota archaeon]